MATTIEGKILAALLTRVSNLPLTPALPVAWPNVDYTPPKSGKFLRVNFIPNVTQRIFIGSGDPHRFIGILQVSVMWPLDGGEVAPREIAGAIAAHFPADLSLVEDGISVRITSRPAVADMIVEDNRVMIPVSIEYECYA